MNCQNGTWQVTYTDVSSNTNATTSDLTLDLVSARFGGTVLVLDGFEYPLAGAAGLTRSIQISYSGIASLAPGSYPFDGIIRTLNHGETAPPHTVRIRSTSNGALVIDAIEGKRLTFHVTAAMAPSPLGSFGGLPSGTFTLNVSGVVEQIGP